MSRGDCICVGVLIRKVRIALLTRCAAQMYLANHLSTVSDNGPSRSGRNDPSTGLLSSSAGSSQAGDTVEFVGPRHGGFVPRPESQRFPLTGDESAKPAIKAILASLPAYLFGLVLIGTGYHGPHEAFFTGRMSDFAGLFPAGPVGRRFSIAHLPGQRSDYASHRPSMGSRRNRPVSPQVELCRRISGAWQRRTFARRATGKVRGAFTRPCASLAAETADRMAPGARVECE